MSGPAPSIRQTIKPAAPAALKCECRPGDVWPGGYWTEPQGVLSVL